MTEDRIRNWALSYLGRFAATEAHLVRILERKIERHVQQDQNPDRDNDHMDRLRAAARVVARDMVRTGIIDDQAFAGARAQSLLRLGKSRRAIRQQLAHKGVGPEEIAKALAGLADEQTDRGEEEVLDLQAALTLARRKRLGPFRRQPLPDDRVRRREYGAFARGGFGYAVARMVIEAEDEEELLAALTEKGLPGGGIDD